MACFLGMSVGCLGRVAQAELDGTVAPAGVLAVCSAWRGSVGYYRRSVGSWWTSETRARRSWSTSAPSTCPRTRRHFVVPIEVVAGVFFVLIALCSSGSDRCMGRALRRDPEPGGGPTRQHLGSLAGIAVFGVASYFCTSPVVWFLPICFGRASISWCSRGPLHGTGRGRTARLLGGRGGMAFDTRRTETISGHPITRSYHAASRQIDDNNIGHQGMAADRRAARATAAPSAEPRRRRNAVETC